VERIGTSRTTVRLGLGLVLAFVLVSVGCGTIAGVDFDKARLADSNDGLDGSAPSFEGPGGGTPRGDADGGVHASTCTPDPNAVTCADRCGPTEDNCKSSRECSTDCGTGKACAGGKCECVSDGTWCNNRCGQTQDNCGRPVDCGGCSGVGVECTANACGCTPEPVATTCAGKSCGTAVNNCGQTVACGNNGACAAAGAICKSDGSCCSDNGAACNGRCGGVRVTNNCGQEIGCPAQCPASQVCAGTSCCTPEPITTTCAGVACGPKVNNCGQTVICPDTCGPGKMCGAGAVGPNACCSPSLNPCGSRCSGTVVDNCGRTVTCNQLCSDGPCGCHTGTCRPNGICECNYNQLCP